MKTIEYKPIGVIYTPFKSLKDAPNQPNYNRNIEAKIKKFVEDYG
jgi:tRNA (Thr-GGU) A37 N-methylase